MNIVTVIIPTRNHSEYINYLIDNCIATYAGSLFKFEIHDSSDDDKTYKIIEKHNQVNKNSIEYKKYGDGISADEKSYAGMSNVKTEYIYLMGDGIAHNFNDLEKRVSSVLGNVDLLCILPKGHRFNNATTNDCPSLDKFYELSDTLHFASNYFYLLTLYGSTIIRNCLFNHIVSNGLFYNFNCDGRYSYAYISSVFTALSTGNYSFGVMFLSSFPINPYKKEATWTSGEGYCRVHYKEFFEDVYKLPSFYESVKNEIIMNQRIFGNSKSQIIHYRMSGSIKFKYIKKYRKYFKNPSYNYYFTIFVCLTPVWIIKLLRFFRKLLKK